MEKAKLSNKIIDALSVDCVLFGFHASQLKILLVKHGQGASKGNWALPGGWIKYNEDVDEAANRVLKDLTGVSDVYLEQLRAFGNINRFPTKRVITIAYYALIKPENVVLKPGFTASDAQWFSIAKVPRLLYDHKAILQFGFNYLKHKVRHEPIGFNLLPAKFTLHQLQELYEAILETTLDKPNFRRKLINMNLLIRCQEREKGVSHRAATLYKFDRKIYKLLLQKGFAFEL